MKNILVTGGAGYIGSHMVYRLLKDGINVFVLDDFSTSDLKRLQEVERLAKSQVVVINRDLKTSLDDLKFREKIDGIVHFAAYKSVPESVAKPLKYYENNVGGTINLIHWALHNDVDKIVYSSSSAIYGDVKEVPVVEDSIKLPVSPYAKSKLFCENIFEDVYNSDKLDTVSLRYFNVAGNDTSGLFGDSLHSTAIISAIMRAFFNKDGYVEIYGDDYETRDGTPIRDFVHVSDLVDAHLKALEFLQTNTGFTPINIGSEKGYTLLELIQTFEEVVGEKLDYKIKDRKEGDIVVSVADCTKAKELLNWKPERDLKDIFESMLKYYENKRFW